ncbi:FAD-dependent monooxygenase [Phytomonospora endophytica]|uniref:2-polyprenyl-6-methoxyphenol hydroxylase-like FAD-dependent oxidoreductase n=1 Tax=Phytomonospora endophytica TaxID=714109 RepID=A0A841FW40_9ACTN|nr:FAD-dependent monooxygenase [Phytomonospora endophytica]MBB6038973.1 2-polyprenyl-6-methoxyphenol hydroxylase-like FAD-dependent oxidoreductase [Phytomonospora endophytica]GIG67923.1 FAD-dependent oxidoreductase [Phytomonospora endophytica]
MTDVLISGASIAGPALAWWLAQAGNHVTVVERAPGIRDGGQAVDFRGRAHMAVLDRMGVTDAVRDLATGGTRLSVVDATGRTKVSLPESFTGGAVEIERGRLARLLYERTRGQVEYVFDDSIASLAQTAVGVDVTLDSGRQLTAGVVVGADGLHSNVRRLAFGPEEDYVSHSGYHIGLFDVPTSFARAGADLIYNEPGRAVSVGPASRGASAMFVFHDAALRYDHRDTDAHRRILTGAFAGMGWIAPELLREAATAPNLYFDSIALVETDACVRGRIALLGDAGYGATCGGMGAGLALVAAYVLARELGGHDPATALKRYESRILPYAAGCRKVAAGAGPFLAPPTAARLWMRDRMYRLLSSRAFAGMLERMSVKAAEGIALD